MTAAVAGLHLTFRSDQCQLAGRLQGFANDAATTTETITVTVVPAKPRQFSETTALFTAHSEVAEPVDWTLARLGDGAEVITQHRPSQPDAQMLMRGNLLTLSLDVPPGSAIDPYQFPLFNVTLGRLLLWRGHLIVHASVVDTPAGALLFTAPSGTGKSTIATLFSHAGAAIVNDDMVALQFTADGVVAHNIPMRLYPQRPRQARLRALFYLRQCPEHRLTRLSPAQAAAKLLSQTPLPTPDVESIARLTQSVARLAQLLPMSILDFAPTPDVVPFVTQALGHG